MSLSNMSGPSVAEFVITGFDHLPHQSALGLVILLTYCLVLLCCGTNICVIASNRRLHCPMYLLICNLATVDVMFTTSASTTMISALLAKDKIISYHSCISRMYFYHLGDITEALALSLMALDRTIAISTPLRYTSIITNLRIFTLIIISWFIGFGCMGKVASIADQLPYCQPIIKYVFCDYASLIRAACVDPEPYFYIPSVLAVWLIMGQLPLILLSYAKAVYAVLKLPHNESKCQVFTTVGCHFIPVASYFSPKLVSVLLTRVGVRMNLTERNALLIVATMVPPLINPTVYCLRTKEIKAVLLNILHRHVVARIKEWKSVRPP